MKTAFFKAAVLSVLLALVCPDSALGGYGYATIKNRKRNKTLTSWKIHITGAAGFYVTSVTNRDGTELEGFDVKTTNNPTGGGDADIELTGGDMAYGESLKIKINFVGTYHGNTKVTKDYKKVEEYRIDQSKVGDDWNTVFADSEVVYGGPSGREFLGVGIPPDTYGFFYQVTNEDPAERVQLLSLELGQASQEPYGFGTLNYPHNGERECDDPNDTIESGCEATFEELGEYPGVGPFMWEYDEYAGRAIADFGPGVFPGESSNVFYFFCAETCNAVNLPDSELLADSGPAETKLLVPAAVPPWTEDFDSYETGSGLHHQGGWRGWDYDPAFDAFATDAQARSVPNSVDIAADADLVHEFAGCVEGQWVFTAWQYIPADFSSNGSGDFAGTYFIMLNTYTDGAPHEESDWSVQMNFDSNDGMLKVYHGNGLNTVNVPYVPEQWVEIQVVIDLNEDLTQIYYDGEFIVEYSWMDGVLGEGGGARNIDAVDLLANGATSVYYDDMSLEPRAADCPGDIDGDGDTDHSDLGELLAAWCTHEGDPNWNPNADLDGDGHVGHGDLGVLLADWGCGT